MGGEGSGRKANPVNVYTPTRVNLASPVGGTSYELPNLSGVRDGGTKSSGFKTGSGAVVFVNSDGDFATDSSNLYWDDTNNRLGIGTVNPSSNLDINGSVFIEGTNKLSFTSNGNDYIQSPSAGVLQVVGRGGIKFYADSNANDGSTVSEIEFHTSDAAGVSASSSKMNIRNDGVIGIGVPPLNIQTKLHLSGGAFTISNTTAPSTPVAAAAFFSSGGAMWVIGSSGTQTLVGPA